MTSDGRLRGVRRAFGQVRGWRLLILLLVPLVLGLLSDWLRDERVVFPAPLPAFHPVADRP